MGARGYTLLEVVIVIIIMGIVAVFVGPVLSTALGSYDATSRNVEVLTRMRYAMERMEREIRHVRRAATNSANYDIATMSSSQLVFTKPDGNQVSIDNLTAGEVRLGYSTPAASATLTDAVTEFCISYCRIDGTTCTLNAGTCTASGLTVDATNVAFAEIRMKLAGSGTLEYTNTMRVALRIP